LALADARCLDNGGQGPVLFSPAASRGYEERLPAPSLCLCTCTVLVPSSPHHRICSLSCVSSFLGKYFTRHARQLFRRLSPAHPTLADARSSANFEATASASLSHPCSVLGSLDFPCTGTEAVRFCTSRCLRSRSVQPWRLCLPPPPQGGRELIHPCSGSAFAYPEIRRCDIFNKDEWPSHRPSAR
jgi:hypothetical protein